MSNKRRRSKIWEQFYETPDHQKAICKSCGESLSGKSKNGTSHLKRHLQSCKNHSNKDANQPLTLTSKDEVRNIGLTHHQIVEVKKAILAEIPFASPTRKKYWNSLTGSMDIEKDICTYYKHEEAKFACELTSRVCFSFIVDKEYILIVAHYIDEDFNLLRKLIGFKKLDDYYPTIETINFLNKLTSIDDDFDDYIELCISEAIKSCIVDWKLGDKIFSFVGGRYYIGSQYFNPLESLKDELSSKMLLNGKFFKVPVYINNVKDFYKKYIYFLYETEAANIQKFRQDLKNFPNTMENFNNITQEMGLPPFNMDLFRWFPLSISFPYLTFQTLKDISVYKHVFCQYEKIAGQLMTMCADQLDVANSTCLYPHEDTDQASLSKSNMGSSVNWKRVEGLVQFSDVASKIVDKLDPLNCPTSNLCFPKIVEMEDLVLKIIYQGSCENWDSLLDEDSGKFFEMANALDPRYKLTFSKYYWQRRFGLDIESKIDENRKLLEEVFNAYAKEDIREASPACIESTNTQVQGSLSNSILQCSNIIDEFSMFIKENQKNKKSELDKYLEDELVDLNDASFNVLGWWKQNRVRYPILSRMARDVLAVPTFNYSLEHIINENFINVTKEVSPELVEAVICIKDWILSEEKSFPESNS